MADETKTSEEEEAMSNDDFLAMLAEGAGYTEPKPDPEASQEANQMAGMQHQINMLQLKDETRERSDGFKTKYPNATTATVQKYVKAVRENDHDAMGDAIATAIRTESEADTRMEDGPRTLRVEGASDDEGGLPDVPMNWNSAALESAGVDASDLF